jgi:hypothetical protein
MDQEGAVGGVENIAPHRIILCFIPAQEYIGSIMQYASYVR